MKGWQVRGVDKVTYASNKDVLKEFSKYKNFVFVQKDICDINWLYDCDYIINTAAETHVDNSIVKNHEFVHSNVSGVHNLLEQIRTKKHFRYPIFFHFSTDEVYGDIDSGEFNENKLLRPSNPYSATKAAADQLILAWHRTYGIPYVILRPTNNYGEGQYVEKLIPKTCKFLSIDRKIPLHENGTPIRNWLNARDTAKAVCGIIEANIKNEIFNLAGDYETSNINVVKKLVTEHYLSNNNALSSNWTDVHVDFTCTRPGQDLRYALDDSKIKQAIDWKPTCIFSNEIKNIYGYYKGKYVW
jgi:dTDP-glucose 4,6-dehydratase